MVKDKAHWMAEMKSSLVIDCGCCAGLCCVSLYCAKVDGFPEDKKAGIPCSHLMKDFRCDIHGSLATRGLKGCLSYDCFGAGQKATEMFRSRRDWEKNPEISDEMFRAFHGIFQLHQMKWFLLEALRLTDSQEMEEEIRTLIDWNESMTNLAPKEDAAREIESYRARVNPLLKEVINTKAARFSKASESRDFTMAILIGSDFSRRSLGESLFLGADLRDVNVAGADLSKCHFLTQMQINSAKGDSKTKLPDGLITPEHWF